MGGLFNKTGQHPVRFDGVFFAGEHVEVLEGDTTALARDIFDFLFKGGEGSDAGDVSQGFCPELGQEFGEAIDGFGFQDAIAGGGALAVLVDFMRHAVRAIRFVDQEKVGDGELFFRGKMSGGGETRKGAKAGDGVFDGAVADSDGENGVYHAEGQVGVAIVCFLGSGQLEMGLAIFSQALGRWYGIPNHLDTDESR